MTEPSDREDDEPLRPGRRGSDPRRAKARSRSTRRLVGGEPDPARGAAQRDHRGGAVLGPRPASASRSSGDWEKALFAIILAGMLDGIDGRIARLLKAQSRFGAELDSLADSARASAWPRRWCLFLWSLQDLPRFGWFASLAFAICCALRLARFNAQIDVEDQPHKSVGFLHRGAGAARGGAGVPADVSCGSPPASRCSATRSWSRCG